MANLAGKTVIVTGASRGIGAGIALACADEGANVVATARSADKLAETCAAVEARGGKALAVPCDVRDAADIARCVEAAVGKFGGIDVLINNAQTIDYQSLLNSTDQAMMDAVLSGPVAVFRFMKAAYPHLAASKGVIVNVGSDAIHMANVTNYGPYGAAKAGIQALTRTAADEWGKEGIRAFTLHPVSESIMIDQFRERDPEGYARLVAPTPKGHLGDPYEDVGKPLVRLINDADRWHRQTMIINAYGTHEVVEDITSKTLAEA